MIRNGGRGPGIFHFLIALPLEFKMICYFQFQTQWLKLGSCSLLVTVLIYVYTYNFKCSFAAYFLPNSHAFTLSSPTPNPPPPIHRFAGTQHCSCWVEFFAVYGEDICEYVLDYSHSAAVTGQETFEISLDSYSVQRWVERWHGDRIELLFGHLSTVVVGNLPLADCMWSAVFHKRKIKSTNIYKLYRNNFF